MVRPFSPLRPSPLGAFVSLGDLVPLTSMEISIGNIIGNMAGFLLFQLLIYLV
jgi:hypothetical protein